MINFIRLRLRNENPMIINAGMKKIIMKNIYLLFIAILAILLATCNTPKPDSNYQKTLNDYRQVKNKEFSDMEQSPLTEEQIEHFEGLIYFDPDPSYRIKALLKPFDKQDTFKMVTTTDRKPEYIRFARALFTLNKKQHELEVYRNVELLDQPQYVDYLFIPFTDKTSGEESYGGGRYIDLQLPGGDSLIIDFNYAYNPYCAYNSNYSCPVPPLVNHLNTAIKAGEKAFDH